MNHHELIPYTPRDASLLGAFLSVREGTTYNGGTRAIPALIKRGSTAGREKKARAIIRLDPATYAEWILHH